jgi:hypothetical protein
MISARCNISYTVLIVKRTIVTEENENFLLTSQLFPFKAIKLQYRDTYELLSQFRLPN